MQLLQWRQWRCTEIKQEPTYKNFTCKNVFGLDSPILAYNFEMDSYFEKCSQTLNMQI